MFLQVPLQRVTFASGNAACDKIAAHHSSDAFRLIPLNARVKCSGMDGLTPTGSADADLLPGNMTPTNVSPMRDNGDTKGLSGSAGASSLSGTGNKDLSRFGRARKVSDW